MAIEHILGLVAFVVIVLTLSLLLPTKTRGYRTDASGDGGANAGWFSDGADCGADSGGGDGGGD